MRTITICEGVTLTASEKTLRRYETQKVELAAEQRWRKNAFRWLEEAYKSGDWDLYSDLHKDIFGVRP